MCAKVSPSPFPVFFFSSRFTSFFVVVVVVVVVFVVVFCCCFVLFFVCFHSLLETYHQQVSCTDLGKKCIHGRICS